MKAIIFLLILQGLIISSSNLAFSYSDLPLFSNTEKYSFIIQTDLTSLFKDRGINSRFFNARIIFNGKDSIVLPVQIKTRGSFRNDSCNCKYPPLLLKFDTTTTSNTIFKGITQLKITTFCVTNQMIINEFIVYQMYNLLTPFSYKVQFVDLVMKDIKDPDYSIKIFSFIIEPIELLTKRLNAKPLNFINLDTARICREQMTLLYLFEYMIGNNDWDIGLNKNVKYCEKNSEAIPIPHDFDFCGFINSVFLKHPKYVGYKSLELRTWKKLIRSKSEFTAVFRHFRKKKKEIYFLLSNSNIIDVESKKIMYKYLNSFYWDISIFKIRKIFYNSYQN